MHLILCIDRICALPSPRQQLADAVDLVVGDAGEDVAQIGFGIHVVELGGLDERIDGGGAFATGIRSGEEIVLATERNSADRALGSIVVDLDAAVMKMRISPGRLDNGPSEHFRTDLNQV